MLYPMPPWYFPAREHLMRLRRDPCGWGYGAQDAPCPEPTVLACLALLAADDADDWVDTLELVDASAHWLADVQRADGAVGTAGEPATLCRSTAWAALLWGQLLDYRRPLSCALRWLQQCEELTPGTEDDDLFGGGLAPSARLCQGAPSPRFESAAVAILSLCRNQLAGHQRITDTLRTILGQSLAGGGWPTCGAAGSSMPGPPDAGLTGMILMALRAAGWPETDEVTRACHYLEGALPHAVAPGALSWGLLGHRAWRDRPAGASQWLSRCPADAPAVAGSPACLALLMLADRPQTCALFGVSPASDESLAARLLLPEFLGA